MANHTYTGACQSTDSCTTSEQWIPICGVPGPVVSMGHELTQANLPAAKIMPNYPMSTMVYFQFVFAAITVIIMMGAFLGRMNFLAWIVFVPLWITLSYTVGAFSIWGGGFLFQKGVIDYSGGYVIHLSSGTAGFVGAAIIGPRLAQDREDAQPNNVLLVLVGAGILWIGWNGFNGGDPYAASPDAGAAVLNTNICTAMSLLTWTLLDVIYYKKPQILGAVNGMITGLVAITPAVSHPSSRLSLSAPGLIAAKGRRCRRLGRYHHWCMLRQHPLVEHEPDGQKSPILPQHRRHTRDLPHARCRRFARRVSRRPLRHERRHCSFRADNAGRSY